MEFKIDYYDAFTEAQKTFAKNVVDAQKEVRTQWFDAVEKAQETFNNFPAVKDNEQAKEAVKAYNTWFENMFAATKAMSDESFKVQATLQTAVEKQFELGRKVVSDMIDLTNKATKQATKTVEATVAKTN